MASWKGNRWGLSVPGELTRHVWCAWNGQWKAVLGFSGSWDAFGVEPTPFFVLGYTPQQHDEGAQHKGALLAVFSGQQTIDTQVPLDCPWSIFPEFIEVLRLDGDYLTPVATLRAKLDVQSTHEEARQGLVSVFLDEDEQMLRSNSRVKYVRRRNWVADLPRSTAAWIGSFPVREQTVSQQDDLSVADFGKLEQIAPRIESAGAIDLRITPPARLAPTPDDPDAPDVWNRVQENRVRQLTLQLRNLEDDPEFDVDSLHVVHIPRVSMRHLAWRNAGELGSPSVFNGLKEIRGNIFYENWKRKLREADDQLADEVLRDRAQFATEKVMGILNHLAERDEGPSTQLTIGEHRHTMLDRDAKAILLSMFSVGDHFIVYDMAKRPFRIDGQLAGQLFVAFEVTPDGELRHVPDTYSDESNVIEDLEVKRKELQIDQTIPDITEHLSTWLHHIRFPARLDNLAPLYGVIAQALNLKLETPDLHRPFLENAAAVHLARLLFPDLPFNPKPDDNGSGGNLLARALKMVGCQSALIFDDDLAAQIEAIVHLWQLSSRPAQAKAMQKIVSVAHGLPVNDGAADLDLLTAVEKLTEYSSKLANASNLSSEHHGPSQLLLDARLDPQHAIDLKDALNSLEIKCDMADLGTAPVSMHAFRAGHSLPTIDELQEIFDAYMQSLESEIGHSADGQAAIGRYRAIYAKCQTRQGDLADLNDHVLALHADILTPAIPLETQTLLNEQLSENTEAWKTLDSEILVKTLSRDYPDLAESLGSEAKISIENAPGYLAADAATKDRLEEIAISTRLHDDFTRCSELIERAKGAGQPVPPELERMMLLWPGTHAEVLGISDALEASLSSSASEA